MIELRDLVYSVLSNLTSAQEQADRVACDAARKYRDDDLLQYLPVPNASFDEVDLNLHFAVVGTDDGKCGRQDAAGSRQRPNPSLSLLRRVSHDLAREALRGMGSHDRRKVEGLARHLIDEVAAFIDKCGEVEDEERRDSLIETTLQALENRIFSAFATDEKGQSALSRSADIRTGKLTAILQSVHEEAAFLRDVAPSVPDLRVNLDLTGDEANLQQLNLKLRMRGYRWIATDESGQQKLVPEAQR